MKTFQTEWFKQKIWLNPGLVVTTAGSEISAVLYRRGFFGKWKVANEDTSKEELEFAKSKILRSTGKSGRFVLDSGGFGFKVLPNPVNVDHERYQALSIIDNFLKLKKFLL